MLLGLNLGGELLREALDLVGEHGNIVPKAAVELWLRLHVQEQDDIFERPDLLPLPQAQVLGGAGITRRRDALESVQPAMESNRKSLKKNRGTVADGRSQWQSVGR